MKIVIYTKSNCQNCVAAKSLLNQYGMEYEENNIEKFPEVLSALASIGVRQMPQCFISGQRVGGLVGLQAALKQMGK